MSALCLLPIGKGSDGWLKTGARTTSSTIIASAKPPVKHIPTTPTPGPPQRSCSDAASLRSQTVDRARLLQGEAGELARDARGADGAQRVPAGHGPSRITEEVRQHGSAAGRGDTPPELGHQRGDAGHLADHDDGGPAADPVDVPSRPVRFERLLVKSSSAAFPSACLAGRHGRTVASRVVAGPARSLDPRLPVLVGARHRRRCCARRRPHDRQPCAPRQTTPGHRGSSRAVDAIVVPQGTWASTTRRAPWRSGSGHHGPARCAARSACRSRRSSTTPWPRSAPAPSMPSSWSGPRPGHGRAPAASRPKLRGRLPTRSSRRPPDFVAPVELAAGIVVPPVQQYAMIENALGAAEGLSTEAQRDEVAALWARFNTVAGDNPDAAFRRATHRGRNRHTRSRTTGLSPSPTTSGTRVSGPWTKRPRC